MDDKGNNVIDLIRQMEKLYIEISRLIKCFDKNIQKRGYLLPSSSSSVIKDISQSLNAPENWLPMWLYRNYQNNANKEVLSLNIALDYPEFPERINEPLVLVAKFSGKKVDLDHAWYPWDIYFHFRPLTKRYNKIYLLKDFNLNDNDTLEELSDWSKEEKENLTNHFKAISFIAAPLMEMSDEKNIIKFIDPIFNQ